MSRSCLFCYINENSCFAVCTCNYNSSISYNLLLLNNLSLFLIFLGAEFVVPDSGHRRENQLILENTWVMCEICSKLKMKTPERFYFVVLMSELLAFYRFHMLFWCFHCSVWISKCQMIWYSCQRIRFLFQSWWVQGFFAWRDWACACELLF